MYKTHYIVFQRTCAHCSTWLVQGDTVRDAMSNFCVMIGGARLLADGSLNYEDGIGEPMLYRHPLDAIEAEYKSNDSEGYSWEICQLREEHWAADCAQVFDSANPYEIESLIADCRPTLRRDNPRSRARAFVWYLKRGPLVTFYRTARRGRSFEIICRYLLPWKTYPNAERWQGTADDILSELYVDWGAPMS